MAAQEKRAAAEKSVVVFGRIHLTGLGAEDFAHQMHEVLGKSRPNKVPDGPTWAVGDLELQQVSGDTAITGRLGKIHKLTARAYDETERSFVDVALRPEVAEIVRFLIHCPTRVIAFEEKRTRISRASFLEQFRAIYLNSPGAELTTIDIDLVADEVKFLEALSKLHKVGWARFKLVPTNPEPRKAYSGIDEMIRKMRAAKLEATVHAPPDGDLVVQGTFLDDAARMVADGYGEATVQGFDPDRQQSVKLSSKLQVIEMLIDLKTDLQKGLHEIVDFIKDRLRWGS